MPCCLTMVLELLTAHGGGALSRKPLTVLTGRALYWEPLCRKPFTVLGGRAPHPEPPTIPRGGAPYLEPLIVQVGQASSRKPLYGEPITVQVGKDSFWRPLHRQPLAVLGSGVLSMHSTADLRDPNTLPAKTNSGEDPNPWWV